MAIAVILSYKVLFFITVSIAKNIIYLFIYLFEPEHPVSWRVGGPNRRLEIRYSANTG